jgi:hypothetical protein
VLFISRTPSDTTSKPEPYLLESLLKKGDGKSILTLEDAISIYKSDFQEHLNSPDEIEKLIYNAVLAGPHLHPDKFESVFREGTFIEKLRQLVEKVLSDTPLTNGKMPFKDRDMSSVSAAEMAQFIEDSLTEAAAKIRDFAEETMDAEQLKFLYVIANDHMLDWFDEIAKRSFRQSYRLMGSWDRRVWILSRFRKSKRLGGPPFKPFYKRILAYDVALNEFAAKMNSGTRKLIVDLMVKKGEPHTTKVKDKLKQELLELWVAHLRFYPTFVVAEYNDEQNRRYHHHQCSEGVLSLDHVGEGETRAFGEQVENPNDPDPLDLLINLDSNIKELFISSLTDRQREVVISKLSGSEVKDKSERDIADELDISQPSVHERLDLAREKLIDILKSKGFLDPPPSC